MGPNYGDELKALVSALPASRRTARKKPWAKKPDNQLLNKSSHVRVIGSEGEFEGKIP